MSKRRCLPFQIGEINCGLNLLCQISGTMVGLIGAMTKVMSSPFKDVSDQHELNEFIIEVIYGKVIPGMCITMIFGNFYYAWMAVRLMRKEGHTNVCTVPYGINTPAAFAFVFSIVAKAAEAAASDGMDWRDGVMHAWRVGCVANLVSGAIATLCGFAGPLIVRVAPQASLMMALAGLGFTWLGLAQIIEVFKAGHLGLLPLGVALVCFFGDVKTSPMPTAIVVMIVGCITGWLSCEGWPEGSAHPVGGTAEAVSEAFKHFSFYTPSFLDGKSFASIPQVLLENIAVILPVAFVGAVNTLVSVYAAHSVGDMYPIRECLVVDGLTTIVAGLFGSPFGTCVYCGQPQFKAQGGVIYYSFLNCFAFCFLASTGLFAAINAFIPPWGIAPIILFVGLAICQDAFDIIKARHLPAAMIGLFPAVADWILSIWPHEPKPPAGLAALAHGSLLVCIAWVAIGVFIIDRNYMKAAIWALVAMVIAGFGLMHAESADLTFKTFLGKEGQALGTAAGGYAMGYATLAGLFGVLLILRRLGFSRIPPIRMEEKEEMSKAPEEEAEEMVERVTSRHHSHVRQSLFDNMPPDQHGFQQGEVQSESDDSEESVPA